ncbi:hypothetical protein Poli38472_011609 [Pythium oligandrum]|uniref:PA domain-containing protein n=1 Tax=Pythium oligandrum TaxID=41045 RepID=A0A8K1CKH2_PYTOL|nr:hypothetical protein Poli38472_011609 [Pythium oligandrum]|eukprot:TMW64729.1 hypothetical protein Poli38472_011609 [Pythium oligandrum]
MGNNASSAAQGDGLPFVAWKRPGATDESNASAKIVRHFAEPSCYKYERCPRVVTAPIVFADPPKADAELQNRHQLMGSIVIVERGGRVHFPDIVRRVVATGAAGCVFIERAESSGTRSLFDGFHSSGRQQATIPIVLMSKYHADQLIRDQPQRVTIELLSSDRAIQNIVEDDLVVAIATASRAGEVDVLKHMLYGDPTGSIRQRIPIAVALCDAAENGHVECLEILHGFGISLDEPKPNGTTALMVACSVGNVEAARALLIFGANVDLEDVHGSTALMIAARDGRVHCLKLLIRKGARINLSRNRNRGTTALHIASRGGQDECVSILLGAGAALDTESESVKGHRRKIEEAIANPDSSLEDVLALARAGDFSVDILKRELTRDEKYSPWLEQPQIVADVFRLMTHPIQDSDPIDPNYGHYKIHHFCSELAQWYPRRIFTKARLGYGDSDDFDLQKSSSFLKVLFEFLCTPGELDDVLVILFCKTVNHFVLDLNLGPLFIKFLANDGQFVIKWVVKHIGLDSIRDMVVWLLYSDMTTEGQQNVRKTGIFDSLYSRLCSWQSKLSWGVGTPYQRDAIENACLVLKYTLCPPSVYMIGNVATFVDSSDHSLPLITDQHFPNRHNELLKSLLIFSQISGMSFGSLIDLGFTELFRQSTQTCDLIVHEGGALSVVMTLMSTLGYHKRKRDFTGVEDLLKSVKIDLLHGLVSRVPKFVNLCDAVVTGNEAKARQLADVPAEQSVVIKPKGSALSYIVAFLKYCVFLQDASIDALLAVHGLMPCLLKCYGAHPTNNLLHHELTDIIRFVLLDPDQKRSSSCPLLNSLFIGHSNIVDFVTRSYESHVEYKGHLTTIANSIYTLTSTPVYKADENVITCQEIARSYTSKHENWGKFVAILAEQNILEMKPLGQRNAPLCDWCLRLKEQSIEYVSDVLASEVEFTGHLETIFSGPASHYCKVNKTDDFITGFLYKKDKIHDHIPIPDPTRVSSFIQFPVPMPFHALTFTLTYFGLCRKCDKLWYCDTLQSANWANRMKWVIPTSARKWYTFGVKEGPGSGAHCIQFSTKGYKNFIVVSDTWGRQEQWMHALEEAILGLSSQASRRMDPASAMAFDIDNEVDPEEFDVKTLTRSASAADIDARSSRRRSKTHSGSIVQMEKNDEASSDDDSDSDSCSSSESAPPKLTLSVRLAIEDALKTGKPIPVSPPKRSSSSRRGSETPRSLSKLDIKQLKEDTKRYTEVLNKLGLASPPNSDSLRGAALSSPVKLRVKAVPPGLRNTPSPARSAGLRSQTTEQLGNPKPTGLGMRQVMSTNDLQSLK